MKRIFSIAIIALSTQVYAQTKDTKALETLKTNALNKEQQKLESNKQETKDPFADLNLTDEQKAKIEALFQSNEDSKTKELKQKAGAKLEEAKERVEATKEKLQDKKDINKKKQADTKDKIASKKTEIKEKHIKNKKLIEAKKDSLLNNEKINSDSLTYKFNHYKKQFKQEKDSLNTTKINLTEGQKQKLEALKQQYKAKQKALTPNASEIEKELESILTPEQLAQFKK